MYMKGCIGFQTNHQCMRIPASLYYDQHSPLLYYMESKAHFKKQTNILTSLKSDASFSQPMKYSVLILNFYQFDKRKKMSDNCFL